jgi:hypothetical protein
MHGEAELRKAERCKKLAELQSQFKKSQKKDMEDKLNTRQS